MCFKIFPTENIHPGKNASQKKKKTSAHICTKMLRQLRRSVTARHPLSLWWFCHCQYILSAKVKSCWVYFQNFFGWVGEICRSLPTPKKKNVRKKKRLCSWTFFTLNVHYNWLQWQRAGRLLWDPRQLSSGNASQPESWSIEDFV